MYMCVKGSTSTLVAEKPISVCQVLVDDKALYVHHIAVILRQFTLELYQTGEELLMAE